MPHRTSTRRTRSAVLVASLVAGAALAGVLTWRSPDSGLLPSFPTASLMGALGAAHDGGPGGTTLGPDDGVVPDGVVTVHDDVPAVTNLDPRLLAALRRAAGEAAGEGVRLYVNSGWRSAAYQAQLLRDAVRKYGSEREAARWVATAETSPHVSGDAVDIGRPDAAEWLSRHGAGHGLCRVYRNEPWHFELRPDAARDGCPALYADPTQDPRMQR